jgi:hypothetical protein
MRTQAAEDENSGYRIFYEPPVQYHEPLSSKIPQGGIG